MLVGPMGRPLRQAGMDVAARGPIELRGAFGAAQREWALTTDFERTVTVLKDRLDDPTADATCETLLVVHEVGGEVDSRLAALAEDRRRDLEDRKDARAKMAGARTARLFVVLSPSAWPSPGSTSATVGTRTAPRRDRPWWRSGSDSSPSAGGGRPD